MAKAVNWLIAATLGRPKKADLIAAINAIPSAYRGDPRVMPKTNADKLAFLREAREAYYRDTRDPATGRGSAPDRADQDHFPGRRNPRRARRKKPVTADLCDVTAAACNDFLRSLPEIPLFGEAE